MAQFFRDADDKLYTGRNETTDDLPLHLGRNCVVERKHISLVLATPTDDHKQRETDEETNLRQTIDYRKASFYATSKEVEVAFAISIPPTGRPLHAGAQEPQENSYLYTPRPIVRCGVQYAVKLVDEEIQYKQQNVSSSDSREHILSVSKSKNSECRALQTRPDLTSKTSSTIRRPHRVAQLQQQKSLRIASDCILQRETTLFCERGQRKPDQRRQTPQIAEISPHKSRSYY